MRDQIPEFMPGVGNVGVDGTSEPARVRAGWLTDTDIGSAAAACPAPLNAPTGRNTPLHQRGTPVSGEVAVFLMKPQPWMKHANCVDADPALFFPERGQPSARRQRPSAWPARSASECLNFALSINERHGIWGGASEKERRVLRRKWTGPRRRQRLTDADPADCQQRGRADPVERGGAIGRRRRIDGGRA